MPGRRKKRSPLGRLSRSEWEIMLLCWRLGRARVRRVLEEDQKTRDRDYRTILTFMSRMAKKGYLTVEREGNKNLYTPAFSQDEGVRREIGFFLDEVVGSEVGNLRLLEQALKEKKAALGASGGKRKKR